MNNEIERDSKGINKELYKRVEEVIKPKKENGKKVVEEGRLEYKRVSRNFKVMTRWNTTVMFLSWFLAEGFMQMIVGSNNTPYYSMFLICVLLATWYFDTLKRSNPVNILAAWPAKWANVPCHMLVCPSFISAYLLGVYLYANVGMDYHSTIGIAGASFIGFLYLFAPIFKLCKKNSPYYTQEHFDLYFLDFIMYPFGVFFGKMLIVDFLLGYNFLPYIDALYWLPYGVPVDITDAYYNFIGSIEY
ncbi:hypothetical protein AB4323_17195 [Vibrio sp. 10N.261.52.C11]|uniref:hypothetical protein n=1 Tax=Vibrio sp. 10N.261.52.C11 TaxID=3229680 RepID=UPI00354BAF29